jgi:uncharacterized membrane protein
MNTTSNITSKKPQYDIFSKRGLCIIMMACVLIVAGFFLMSGQGSTEQAFNPDIFSPQRIVIAPLLCLAGYILIIIGVLISPSRRSAQSP